MAIGAIVWWWNESQAPREREVPALTHLSSSGQTAGPALAVLPLDDLSPGAREEYFSDGLTDALINELGSIGNLRVISRTSVMRYKVGGYGYIPGGASKTGSFSLPF